MALPIERKATNYLDIGSDSIGNFILDEKLTRIYDTDPRFEELNSLFMDKVRKETTEKLKLYQSGKGKPSDKHRYA